MNLWLVFVFFLYKIVINPSRSEVTDNVDVSQNKLSLKNIGRLKYRDGEIHISQDQEKASEFFFTPFPSFQSTKAECHENILTDRLELGLGIEFYASDVVESVQEHLYKHYSKLCGDRSSSFRCVISLLSMNSVRIVQRNARLNVNPNKYTLDDTWQSAAFLSQSMNFHLYPSNRTACDKIRSALIDHCAAPDFELQYTITDEQRISKELEVITEHITKTVLYPRIRARFSSSETIMLSDDDLKELINQSIERLTLELRMKGNFLALEDFQSLAKHLEQELATEQIRLEADDNKLWSNLYWNSDSIRPDELAVVLNSILQKDATDDEKFIYYHHKAINQPRLLFTPHDIYHTKSIESDEDEDSAFVQSLRSNRVLSPRAKQPLKSNSTTTVVATDTNRKTRQNLMIIRSEQSTNTNEEYLLTHQMVVDYLQKLSDRIYLDDEDNTIKPYAINARLIRFNKFKINTKLFSSTVLVTIQPHIYKLPVRCRANENDSDTKSSSWITDRLQRLENLFNNRTNQTCTIPNESSKENQSIKQIKQVKTDLLESNKQIQEFKTRLDKLEEKQTTNFIQPGKRFGGLGGGDFDDSKSLSLSASFYISGIRCSQDLNNVQGCQFIYSSFHDNGIRIYSNVHGNNGDNINSSQIFHLDKDERIARIEVKIGEEGFHFGDERIHMLKVIQGLKLITTEGRIIPPDSQLSGSVKGEHYPGYVLGYATGKAGLRIDQLRFYWIRDN